MFFMTLIFYFLTDKSKQLREGGESAKNQHLDFSGIINSAIKHILYAAFVLQSTQHMWRLSFIQILASCNLFISAAVAAGRSPARRPLPQHSAFKDEYSQLGFGRKGAAKRNREMSRIERQEVCATGICVCFFSASDIWRGSKPSPCDPFCPVCYPTAAQFCCDCGCNGKCPGLCSHLTSQLWDGQVISTEN